MADNMLPFLYVTYTTLVALSASALVGEIFSNQTSALVEEILSNDHVAFIPKKQGANKNIWRINGSNKSIRQDFKEESESCFFSAK